VGLISRLFGLPSFAGSTNALLVELTLPALSDQQRSELKVRAVEVFRKIGSPDMSAEAALADLNHASRITQLNILALAMKELGYKPILSTERLRKVRDPFSPDLVDEHTLRAVARRLKWAHGVEAHIGEEPISFDSW
jgi:hypothetical protein